jgi:hypothetical protein
MIDYDSVALTKWCIPWQNVLELAGKLKALKRVKVHLFRGQDEEYRGAAGDMYGFSPEVIQRIQLPAYNWKDENSFVRILSMFKRVVDKGIFPDRVKQADGSWRQVERIMDFRLKWFDYSRNYHEKNWRAISAILKACHTAFGGGELWADGILCWKENIAQPCMNSYGNMRSDERFRELRISEGK